MQIKRRSSVSFTAPYSFDKDTLFAILEKEKEKVTAKLEEFAQLLRDAKVRKITRRRSHRNVCILQSIGMQSLHDSKF